MTKLATSEFGNRRDLKELLGDDGFIISSNIQLAEKFSNEGIVVMGATGTGKTTSLFYPNLLEDCLNGSIVTMDPKRELWNDTHKYQKSIGREPLLFSPLDPSNSAKYNPLELCKNASEVIQLAQLILLNGSKSLEIQTGVKAGGVEWINMAVPLFSAALLYARSKGKPFCTITNAVRLLINTNVLDLDALFNNCSEDIKEQFNIFMQSAESPRTAASIKSTLANNIQLFLDENIIRVTSDTDFTAEDLRNQRIALYINYQEIKSAYLSPFIGVFISQLINHLYEDEPFTNPVHFMFDEFANVGVINNISSILSTSRSRKLSFLLCLQSISQLVQLYGDHNSKSILNNLKTKCILSSVSDPETLRYVSEISGMTEIIVKSESKSGDKTSCSYSKQKRNLLNSDEIRRLEKDEILIIAHNKQPVKSIQNIYYKNSDYLNKIGG